MQDVMSVNQKEYIDGPTIYDLMKNDANESYEKNGFKLSNGTICMYCE